MIESSTEAASSTRQCSRRKVQYLWIGVLYFIEDRPVKDCEVEELETREFAVKFR